jgi:RNA polymerase sigma factor (sigma-70 family)
MQPHHQITRPVENFPLEESMSETREIDLDKYLPLAGKIAQSFSNIPGLDSREIEMRAQEALADAGRGYDPAKGEFSPYAAQAIRNALSTLHQKQLRHHQHHAYTLDQAGSFSTQADVVQQTQDPGQDSVATQAHRAESIAALQRCLSKLSAKQQRILQAVGKGLSYTEIGEKNGVSKQAAHKMAASAIQSLRELLAEEGFGGLDSVGLLKSFRRE